jgi:hypothetical protein
MDYEALMFYITGPWGAFLNFLSYPFFKPASTLLLNQDLMKIWDFQVASLTLKEAQCWFSLKRLSNDSNESRWGGLINL